MIFFEKKCRHAKNQPCLGLVLLLIEEFLPHFYYEKLNLDWFFVFSCVYGSLFLCFLFRFFCRMICDLNFLIGVLFDLHFINRLLFYFYYLYRFLHLFYFRCLDRFISGLFYFLYGFSLCVNLCAWFCFHLIFLS